MNRLNPRSVKDHERYASGLNTKSARDAFWRLRDSLGHDFWSRAQDVLEQNLRRSANKQGMIAAIARARKAKKQREWRETKERRQSLQNFARASAVYKPEEEKTSNQNASAAEWEGLLRLDELKVEYVDFAGINTDGSYGEFSRLPLDSGVITFKRS